MSGSDFFVEFRSVIRVRCVYTADSVAFENRILRGLSRKY